MDRKLDRHTYENDRTDRQIFGDRDYTFNQIGIYSDKNKIGVLIGKVI